MNVFCEMCIKLCVNRLIQKGSLVSILKSQSRATQKEQL